MRRNKIKITLLTVLVALLTLITQSTLAYYTVTGTAENVITSGDISAQIIEKMGDVDFPEEGVYVMPGSVVSKKVSVLNTGGNPFWLRVKLTNRVDGAALQTDITKLDINTENWTAGDDGYYYYYRVLEPEEETEKLFTEVEIVGSVVDSSYMGKILNLTVSAYAVQSQNNGDSPFDAEGWPAEGGESV